MRRTAVVASLLALSLVTRAEAADAVPPPTVAVSVKASGVALPKATTTATWLVGGAGQQGELVIDSYNLPGMVTTVDALWTSRDFRVYAKIPAFEYIIETTHQGSPTSSMPAAISYGLRWRDAGGPWQPWRDVSEVYQAGFPLQGQQSGHDLTFRSAHKNKVQVQFRIHTEMTDGSKEHESWKVLANI